MSSLAADNVLMFGTGGAGIVFCAAGHLLGAISIDQISSFCCRLIDFNSRIDNGSSSLRIIRNYQAYLAAGYTYCKVAVRRYHIAACCGEITYIAGTIIAISA